MEGVAMCQHPSTATPKAKKHLDVSFKDVLKCKKIYFWSLLHFSCVVFIILTSILVGTSLFFTWLCLGNTSQRRIILKPPTDLKEYRHIQLENGLEAMLICDAHTSKSSAALAVRAGSLNDPEEHQGLAHFLEHLLFMGTEKYPDEAEYSAYLSDHGGSSNAYTDAELTNYYFDVNSGDFEEALDRFSQFFIAPLFSPTCTEREILAVDSEHKKNIPNDSWRVFGLLRQLSSKRHPAHKFATGTVQTLQGTSSIADIRDILINFYESHYSADMMKLVIYSKESLPAMEKMVREKFSVIKSLGIREEKLPPAWVNIPLFDAEAFKRIVWVKPLMDLKTLSIIFFPSDYSVPYKSRVLAYLTQLFGYEGPGSLSSYFHSRNWITSLVAWSNSNISGSNELYIDLTLTSFGVENYLEIIKSVFAFVNLLKAQGPQRRFFDDCQRRAEMHYRFQNKNAPTAETSKRAERLHYVPPEEINFSLFDWSNYNPDLLKRAVDELNVDNFFVVFLQNEISIKYPLIETHYGTEYALEPLDQSFLNELVNMKHYSFRFALPLPNPYLASDFTIYSHGVQSNSKYPSLISSDPQFKVWYKLDEIFRLPKTFIQIIIRNPFIRLDIHNYARALIWINALERHLLDMSYTASLAGLDFSLDITIDAILITAKGFSQKLPLFLHNMMEEIVSFSVDVENFDIVHHRLMQDFKNFRKLAPYYHSSFYAEFCLWEYGFSNEDMLIALPAVDFESIKGIKEYYFKNISCESFIFGNIVEREALFLVKQLGKLIFAEVHTRHSLSPELLPSNHRLVLRPPTNLVLLRRVDNTNSAITMCIQVSELTNYKGLLFTMLFVQFYGQLFFDQLRTKEQLGYIVYLIMTKTSFTVDLKFTIQSAAQGPSYLYRSIQSFLSSLETDLHGLSEEKFKAGLGNLSYTLRQRCDSMPSEFQHFLQFITSLRYDFDLNLRLQRVLSTLTKEDFVQFCLEKIVHQEKRKQVTAAILACPTSPRMCSINLQAEERNFVGLGAQVISIKKLRSWKGKQSYFPCDPTIKACQTCT